MWEGIKPAGLIPVEACSLLQGKTPVAKLPAIRSVIVAQLDCPVPRSSLTGPTWYSHSFNDNPSILNQTTTSLLCDTLSPELLFSTFLHIANPLSDWSEHSRATVMNVLKIQRYSPHSRQLLQLLVLVLRCVAQSNQPFQVESS